MNNFFLFWIAPGWLLWTVNFLFLTTDFEMSETCELLSWYLGGCKVRGKSHRKKVTGKKVLKIEDLKENKYNLYIHGVGYNCHV